MQRAGLAQDIYIYLSLSLSLSLSLCMYIYIYIYDYAYVYVYVYVYVYIYIYMYMYIYLFICLYTYTKGVTEIVRSCFNGFRRRHHPTFFFMVSVVGFLVDSAAAGGSIILDRLERFLAFCVFRIGFRLWLFYGFRYVLMVSVTLFVVSVAGFLVDSAAAGGSNILERLERFLVCCVFRTGFRRWFFYGFRRGRKTLFNGFRRCLFNGFRRGKELFMVSVVGCFLWFPAATGLRLSLRWKP